MRARGFEPLPPIGDKDLNLARLPIPPRSRSSRRTYLLGVSLVGLRLILLTDLLDAFFGLLQYIAAVLYQGHALLVLLDALLQRDLALLNLRNDRGKLLDGLLEGQLANTAILFGTHIFNFHSS